MEKIMNTMETMHLLEKIEKNTIELFVVCLKVFFIYHLVNILLQALYQKFVLL